MAILTVRPVPHGGLNLTHVAASAGGDQAATGSGLLLHVKNGDSASHTVTLVTPQTEDGLAVADRAVTVAAGADSYIPLLDLYRNPDTGLASITYDGVTSVTVGVLRVA
jgi:hypothetical protein